MLASIIVPAYNTKTTLPETIKAILAQTMTSFELIIVDDGSTDGTAEMANSFTADSRVRVIHQCNRGLAGARNTGIAAARGAYIGFCDADDIWEPRKLALHVAHLVRNPKVGVSFAGSSLIDDTGGFLGTAQKPRLRNITAGHILKRNPIGNGSAAMFRRDVFEQIAYRPKHETERDWYFDETFRQSEDIECWVRIAVTTDWVFEGIPGLLTRYRISSGGLSANTARQLMSWEKMLQKIETISPKLVKKHGGIARAYQHRYLARRAICDRDVGKVFEHLGQSFGQSKRILIEEPVKTLSTVVAAVVLHLGGALVMDLLMNEQKG